MTFDDLKAKMVSLGFKFQPSSRDPDGHSGFFFRRIPEVKRECLTNEGKLLFVVELYDRARFEHLKAADWPERFSFEAEIAGEYAKDLWTKLRVYGLRPEVFFEKHKDVEAALLRAWEALT